MFPTNATVEVHMVNGRKEGVATVFSEKRSLLANLNYKNDQLDGNCLFMNENGECVVEMDFVNGKADGWFCEYKNNTFLKMDINKNGKVYCELRKHPQNPDYFVEVVKSTVISVCKYSAGHKKNGLCTYFDNKKLRSVVLFENGVEKEKKYEFQNELMLEYDKEGHVVYRGGFKGDAFKGVSDGYCYGYLEETINRCGKGQCFVYDEDRVKEVYNCEDGEMTWKTMDFVYEQLIEFNENGERIYRGEFRGDVKSGFVREGEGEEYIGTVLVYIGGWKDGIREGLGRSYKDRKVYYKGNWEKGRPHGEGALMNGF